MKLFNESLAKEITTQVTWKDLVKEGVELLVEGGFATQKLEDAILESTKQNGAYYVLEKGIALLHAPVGPYALKSGTSLIYLPENVQFNDEDKWARIIVTLSATDATSHMGLIQEFGEIFMNNESKEKLFATKTMDEFFQVYNSLKGGE